MDSFGILYSMDMHFDAIQGVSGVEEEVVMVFFATFVCLFLSMAHALQVSTVISKSPK